MVFRLLRTVGPGVVILRNNYARRFLWAEARYQVVGAWRGVKRKADGVFLRTRLYNLELGLVRAEDPGEFLLVLETKAAK